MHDCLTISEVVSIIFDNLHEESSIRGIGVFASLARTCRAFTEPALDILWRDQHTLVPLIKCFPHEILGTSDIGDVHFLRSPKAQDWARFDYYAPRVRRFGGRQYTARREQGIVRRYDAVIDLLSKLRTYLLPNVHESSLNLGEASISPYTPTYRPYLGPALTSIHIKANSYEDSDVRLLCSDIVSLCPQIQHLTMASLNFISEGIPSLRADAAVSTLIFCLHNPQTINFAFMVQVPQSIITHLATQSSLTTLGNIYVPSSDVDAFTAARFSSLQELYLRTDDWASAAQILSSMDCRFTSLSVECLENSEPLPAIRSLFETLRSSFGTLSAILLESRKATVDVFDTGVEVLDIIRPLLSCKRLQIVTIGLRILEGLNDSWLVEAANAWPSLENLNLLHAAFHCVPRGPKITLYGLVTLIRDFPQIQEILLPLSLHDARISLLNDVSTDHIRRLALGHPPEQRGTLDRLNLWLAFPKLQSCSLSHITYHWSD